MRRTPRIVLAIALALLPGSAFAQAYQCRPPASIGAVPQVRQDGPTRRAPIAAYTLAASWSPEYCNGSGRKEPIQCSGQNGRFGFVLHGLWPEAASGPPPQWCAPKAPPPRPATVRGALCTTPVPWLIAHEWAKHGTCMASTPEGYLKVSNILWHSLRWPDLDRLSRDPASTAGDLRRAFVALNPGWKPEAVGVLTSRTGWLRELKLCYGRDFLPKACRRDSFGPRDGAPLKVWRGR